MAASIFDFIFILKRNKISKRNTQVTRPQRHNWSVSRHFAMFDIIGSMRNPTNLSTNKFNFNFYFRLFSPPNSFLHTVLVAKRSDVDHIIKQFNIHSNQTSNYLSNLKQATSAWDLFIKLIDVCSCVYGRK